MRTAYFGITGFLLVLWLGLGSQPSFAQGRKAMPTAMLPIEPATEDQEVLDNQSFEAAPLEDDTPARARRAAQRSMESHKTAVRGGFLMARDGFGAQLQFLEYTTPWLAVIQSLRYQAQDQEDALFQKQYGLMLGFVLHPWRGARFSPLLSLQAGGDRYRGSWQQVEHDLFGFEAVAGLELQLARAASFLFQWRQLYYPGLTESLFPEQKPNTAYAGSFQVFFNLKWEGFL